MFEKKINITFKDKDLLKQAFTHRSYLNEHKGSEIQHNERLEFLGDAVLELVTTDFLFHKFPEFPEGILTSYRSALVRTENISLVARKMEMNEYLLLSKGESKDVAKARDSILANTFEAFLGALYLDQGYRVVADFLQKYLFENIADFIKKGTWRDAKSYVQEKAQEVYGTTPRYELISEKGPDHEKYFVMSIYFDDKQIAKGEGQSKQDAQQDAALKALEKEGWDTF